MFTNICRFCLNTASMNYEDLKMINEEHFKLILPEIDLRTPRTSVICSECSNLFETCYNFRNRCLETERLINLYIESYSSSSDIDLNEVIKYRTTINSDSRKTDVVKSEEENEGFGDDNYQSDIEDSDQATLRLLTSNYDGLTKDLISSENSVLKCEICDKIFDEKITLEDHLKNHFYRLRCESCEKSFSTIQSFRKHLLSIHNNLFKRKLQGIENLLVIQYKKDNSISNNCPICFKQTNCNCFNSNVCESCNKLIPKDDLFKHKLSHLIKTSNFKCEYCQKTFMRKSALTRHIEEVHFGIRKKYNPRSVYTCDICGSTTHRKSRLTQHMRTHTGEKPYKCDECEKAFAQSSQLGVHKRTKHSNSSRFTCEYCSKPLKSKYSLNMHILIVHKPEELERKFRCHVCEKKFRFPGELTNHLTWHSEERKFGCEICGKRFVNQPSVKKHMVIHSGEKKHKCEICGKGFHHKSYIKVHMKVHKRIL